MISKLKATVEVTAKLNGGMGDPENIADPRDADATPDAGGGDTGGGTGGTGGSGDAPTGGAGQGAATDDLGGFVTCAGRIGVSEEELLAQDNEFGSSFGGGADGAARQRAFEAGLDGSSNPEVVGTNNARAVPASCRDIANDAPESLRISKYFTVGHFCSRAEGFKYTCRGQLGLSRAEIICNLRHLAVNIMDPIVDHFRPLGFSIVISSGFRHGSGGSDHYRGSAVDLIFTHPSIGRATGAQLTRIQKSIDQQLRLPYTQMIHEANRLLHVACRRSGQNSSTRMYWSTGFGPYSGPGYRQTVSLNGNPRV